MKISKLAKLERAASIDNTRTAIENILITKDGNKPPVAVATDGRIMAIVPVHPDEGAESLADHEFGLISPAALTHGRRLAKESGMVEMNPNGSIAFLDGSSLPRPTQENAGTFPQWQVVRDSALEPKTVFKVALSPALLLDLVTAMGTDGTSVTLDFSGPESPIRVRITNDPAAFGILMPMRIATP